MATLAGLLIALAAIIGGLLLEGGTIKDISQLTAAMIVLGGTCGAVMVSCPLPVVWGAAKRWTNVVFERSQDPSEIAAEIIRYATKARKNGLVSLEQDAQDIDDPFLRKALNLAVDGSDMQDIRKMMELEIFEAEDHAEAEAKVFEAAGGYSPTIGIIGAVLGLIQVMKHLDNIEEVGRGIAVAFVATVYGVAAANLLFLPSANKMKARSREENKIKEMIVEGVAGIVEGMNPKLIQSKLEAYSRHRPGKKVMEKHQGAAVEAAPAEI